MPTETDIYTKSTPADIEQSEENVLTDTAIHTESLLTDIEPSVENVPAETEIPELKRLQLRAYRPTTKSLEGLCLLTAKFLKIRLM